MSQLRAKKSEQANAQNRAGFNALAEDTDGFNILSRMLHKETGILMESTPTNRLKMANRLARVLNKHGHTGYGPYIRMLRAGDRAHLMEFISALTTNTTSFFRETAHFEILKEILPPLCRQKQADPFRELRIWSAASSTGEEAYSIAITVLEKLPLGHGLDVRVLATDIDRNVLARAAKGRFEPDQLKEVSPLLKKKYFRPAPYHGKPMLEIDRRIRNMTRFAPLNLRSPVYPFRFPFDIIFCRNVLIYFDAPTAMEVIDRLTQSLAIGGHLFVGHAELGLVRHSALRPKRMGVYEKILAARTEAKTA